MPESPVGHMFYRATAQFFVNLFGSSVIGALHKTVGDGYEILVELHELGAAPIAWQSCIYEYHFRRTSPFPLTSPFVRTHSLRICRCQRDTNLL